MKTYTLVIVVMLAAYGSFAQESTNTKPKVNGGAGYFQFGYSFFDVDNLNTMLKANGMPEAANGSMSFGGGGHTIISNFILGGEGHGVVGSSNINQTYRVNQSGGYGFFNLGYVVYNNPALVVYPILGIGGGGTSVTLTDRSTLPVSFGNLLADPKHQSVLTKESFMLSLSLSTDLFVLGKMNSGFSGGLTVGLRAGYLLEFNKDRWFIDDHELVDGPESGMSGPFIRLSIGGGGISR